MKAAAVDISKAMCSRYFFHASHISFMSSVISHPNRYSLWVQEMFSFNNTGYTDEWFSYIAFRYELTQGWNYKQEKMDGRMHALHRVCWREIKKKKLNQISEICTFCCYCMVGGCTTVSGYMQSWTHMTHVVIEHRDIHNDIVLTQSNIDLLTS